jgi:hypothetical protein
LATIAATGTFTDVTRPHLALATHSPGVGAFQPVPAIGSPSMSRCPCRAILAGTVAGALLASSSLTAFAQDVRMPSVPPWETDSSTPVAPPAEPFAFADFSWAPGNYGSSDKPLKWGLFTGEVRVDTVYHYSFNHPADDTISGSSEVFRHNEVQVTPLGFGGDFLYKNAQARLMTRFGLYSMTTPRNDASPGRGEWRLDDAYRYISEAYAGYPIDVLNGINIQAGLFMSYIGLWSYYDFDNWTYQPSYVSSNAPWFLDGVRVQIFPSDKLKIEPWLVNGWQSYGNFNKAPGVGAQIPWKPTGWLTVVGNQYVGTDTLGVPGRIRAHTDDSVMAKYHDDKGAAFSKAAASLTLDTGCEWGPRSSSPSWNSTTAPRTCPTSLAPVGHAAGRPPGRAGLGRRRMVARSRARGEPDDRRDDGQILMNGGPPATPSSVLTLS